MAAALESSEVLDLIKEMIDYDELKYNCEQSLSQDNIDMELKGIRIPKELATILGTGDTSKVSSPKSENALSK